MESEESVVKAKKIQVEEDSKYAEKDEEELVVDLDLLREGFTPGPNGEVPLESWVNAYSEMSNFFKILGPVFHFVAYDVNRKVAQLREMLAGEAGQHYVDVRTMLDYEVESGVIKGREGVGYSSDSGTMVLLQLHRALEFTGDFMKELVGEEEEPPLGQVTSTLYKATMGRFHPPILATPISGVLLLLPPRATIRSRLAKGKPAAEEKVKRILPEVVTSVKQTYAACQTLYVERNLHLIE